MYSTRQANEIYQVPDASFGDRFPRQHRDFEKIPLDIAFSDGGWNVMAEEKTLINSLYNDGVSIH